MRKVALPSGGWIRIIDPDRDHEFTVGRRRIVGTLAAQVTPAMRDKLHAAQVDTNDMRVLGFTPDEAALWWQVQDANTVALLESWSFDEPLPTLDTVQALPSLRYDEINTAIVPEAKKLMASGGELDQTPTLEEQPENPTGA